MDKYWSQFWKSGTVNDYLNYKQNEEEQVVSNDDIHQGISDKGTDYRGE